MYGWIELCIGTDSLVYCHFFISGLIFSVSNLS